MKARILITVGVCLLAPAFVLASGLSVSPTRLDFVIKDKTAAPKIQKLSEKSLSSRNPKNSSENFEEKRGVVADYGEVLMKSLQPNSLDSSRNGAFQTVSKEIIVANPTTETVIMEIVPDDFAGLIIPAPQIFSLAPGGRKTVFITLAQNYEKFFFSANKIKTNLSIVAKPLNGGNFSVMSGIKLPVNIKLIQSNQPAHQKQAIGLAALFILLIVWLWKKYEAPRI